jgi:aryl-alcohol dehydrogenase-like predicted oxidoreductase
LSKIDKIILGTVQFGIAYGINNKIGKPSLESVFSILEEAYKLGIRTLDTAEAYGNAHEVISLFHKQSEIRFNIISKFSSTVETYSSNILERIEQHCVSFDIPFLSGYMFHSYDEFTKIIKEQPTLLKSLEGSKYVQKIGVSVYDNYQIENVLRYKEVNLIQLPFNLFDNESRRKNILTKAKLEGVEIHTRSSFLQGLFFKDIEFLSGNLIELKDELTFINQLSKKMNTGIGSLALNYPLSKEFIDKVLIGVDSIEQLRLNVNSINKNFRVNYFNEIDLIKIKNDELLNPAKWKM